MKIVIDIKDNKAEEVEIISTNTSTITEPIKSARQIKDICKSFAMCNSNCPFFNRTSETKACSLAFNPTQWDI